MDGVQAVKLGKRLTLRGMTAHPPSATASDRAGGSSRLAELRSRLVTPMPEDRLGGWLWPLLITLFAAVTRVYRLSVPDAVIFDETFYVKDAWSILKHGVELQLKTDSIGTFSTLNSLLLNTGWLNSEIIAGQTDIFQSCFLTRCTGEFVVQPPAGKLLIAAGEWVYGLNTLGWRIAPAIVGSLAVLLMCRITRRLTRSTLLGCVAGLLLSLDGLEFVLSRTGMLDIFLMFFVLASFGCLVADRDASGPGWPRCWPPAPVTGRNWESARSWASGSGGSPRASSSAWPAPPSRTRSGTTSRSPACASPGTSAPAGRAACRAACSATASGCRSRSA